MSTTANGANSAAVKLSDASLIVDLDLEALREFLQDGGYRAEVVTDGNVTFLRSATSGLPFDIRPGNSFGGPQNRFADVAFVALFAVRGTLPLDLINSWNKSRRFGRLFLDQPVPGQEFLVFCLDVSVAGGIAPRQLRGQIELWDSLIQQLIPWLREELSKIAPKIETAPAAANDGEQTAPIAPAEVAATENA